MNHGPEVVVGKCQTLISKEKGRRSPDGGYNSILVILLMIYLLVYSLLEQDNCCYAYLSFLGLACDKNTSNAEKHSRVTHMFNHD